MEILKGQIVELGNKVCRVALSETIIEASLRGLIHRKDRPYVGDRVDVTDNKDGTFVIEKILKRKTLLYRPAIANLDRLMIVATCKQPPLDIIMLDRCLCAAEANNIQSVILLNKSDLLTDEEKIEIGSFASYYQSLGYEVVVTGNKDIPGTQRILSLCHNSITAFSGVSGAGKSTILNRLLPHLTFRTQEVSRGTQRGVHTTTSSVLVPIGDNGFIADTPGFSALDIPDITEDSVTACFPDIARVVGMCRFNNCTHDTEIGCHVKAEVESGNISWWRLESYHRIRQEVRSKNRDYR